MDAHPSTARTIFIIRHGEKPPDEGGSPYGVDLEGGRNKHSLTPTGWQRAGALAHLFTPSVPGFLEPTELIAPLYPSTSADRPDGDSDDKRRTHQTIMPLAELRGLTIKSRYEVEDEKSLAAELAEKTTGVTLVCWEHRGIPKLASALAPGADVPESWPGCRFDVVFRVCDPMKPSGSFIQLPELLLAGDSDQPIPTKNTTPS